MLEAYTKVLGPRIAKAQPPMGRAANPWRIGGQFAEAERLTTSRSGKAAPASGGTNTTTPDGDEQSGGGVWRKWPIAEDEKLDRQWWRWRAQLGPGIPTHA